MLLEEEDEELLDEGSMQQEILVGCVLVDSSIEVDVLLLAVLGAVWLHAPNTKQTNIGNKRNAFFIVYLTFVKVTPEKTSPSVVLYVKLM